MALFTVEACGDMNLTQWLLYWKYQSFIKGMPASLSMSRVRQQTCLQRQSASKGNNHKHTLTAADEIF
jgi:hypothetical protein